MQMISAEIDIFYMLVYWSCNTIIICVVDIVIICVVVVIIYISHCSPCSLLLPCWPINQMFSSTKLDCVRYQNKITHNIPGVFNSRLPLVRG